MPVKIPRYLIRHILRGIDHDKGHIIYRFVNSIRDIHASISTARVYFDGEAVTSKFTVNDDIFSGVIPYGASCKLVIDHDYSEDGTLLVVINDIIELSLKHSEF